MEQEQLNFIDQAIEEELHDQTEMNVDEKQEQEYYKALEKEIEDESALDEKKTTRRPYKIESIDKAKDRQQEMAVFTNSKKLAEYIMIVTQKSPKKFRWSIVTKLQNSSIYVVELLYKANFEKDNREEHLKTCNTELSLLDFYATTAKKMQAINLKQMLNIGKQIVEVRKMLMGWMRSQNKK